MTMEEPKKVSIATESSSSVPPAATAESSHANENSNLDRLQKEKLNEWIAKYVAKMEAKHAEGLKKQRTEVETAFGKEWKRREDEVRQRLKEKEQDADKRVEEVEARIKSLEFELNEQKREVQMANRAASPDATPNTTNILLFDVEISKKHILRGMRLLPWADVESKWWWRFYTKSRVESCIFLCCCLLIEYRSQTSNPPRPAHPHKWSYLPAIQPIRSDWFYSRIS
jgi:hypothetical protein